MTLGYIMQNVQVGKIKNDKDKRSKEEIYWSIVNRIKVLAKEELSEQEAHSAARNLISFCQILIDYKINSKKKR